MSLTKTCEFVTPKHPDKVCDVVADTILDAYLAGDPLSRVAIEVMGGHGRINVSGEVTSQSKVNLESIIRKIVGPKLEINLNVSKQSPEIARGVDVGGAGDQGIMVGYATSETKALMPYEYELSRSLCQKIYKKYPYDGKVQVTVEGKKVLSVVASFQNAKRDDLEKLVRKLVKAKEYWINEAGDWQIGGFEADSGLSGRKIIVDAYGPEVPVGGGSFSGKDSTKVDRSGAYMARKIAVDYLKKFKAKEVTVKLAYVIGRAQPVMATAVVDGRAKEVTDYDLTPSGIIKKLGLRSPKFANTCTWGHFGRGFKWDK